MRVAVILLFSAMFAVCPGPSPAGESQTVTLEELSKWRLTLEVDQADTNKPIDGRFLYTGPRSTCEGSLHQTNSSGGTELVLLEGLESGKCAPGCSIVVDASLETFREVCGKRVTYKGSVDRISKRPVLAARLAPNGVSGTAREAPSDSRIALPSVLHDAPPNGPPQNRPVVFRGLLLGMTVDEVKARLPLAWKETTGRPYTTRVSLTSSTVLDEDRVPVLLRLQFTPTRADPTPRLDLVAFRWSLPGSDELPPSFERVASYAERGTEVLQDAPRAMVEGHGVRCAPGGGYQASWTKKLYSRREIAGFANPQYGKYDGMYIPSPYEAEVRFSSARDSNCAMMVAATEQKKDISRILAATSAEGITTTDRYACIGDGTTLVAGTETVTYTDKMTSQVVSQESHAVRMVKAGSVNRCKFTLEARCSLSNDPWVKYAPGARLPCALMEVK